MNINIYDTQNPKNYITLPMLPETISYSSTERFQQYEILDVGEVYLPKGRNLCHISWEGIFPALQRKNLSYIHELKKPEFYVDFLERKRKDNKKLEVFISNSVINKRKMYIEEFNYKITSVGDYNYSLKLVDAVDLKLNKVKKQSGKDKKHKVKSNKETLRDIAKKYYGDGKKYKTIYNANKTLIDRRVAKERKKNKKISKYTIFKGQILKIPAASAAEKRKATVLALQKAINKDRSQYKKVSENGKLDAGMKNVLKTIFIYRGKKGEVVKFVQRKTGAKVDGICGSETIKKIKTYQRKNGLKADGIAGYATLMKMVS